MDRGDRGNLTVEEIQETEREPHGPSDYGYHRRKKEGPKSNTRYRVPVRSKYDSREGFLGNAKRIVRLVFHTQENGILTLWEYPQEKDIYYIGAVGAIEYEAKESVAIALNVKTMTQVAELSVKLPPYLFAVAIFRLSVWLNWARIGFERSDYRHGLSLQQSLINGNSQYNAMGIQSLLYQETTDDKVKDKSTNRYGFEFSRDTKISLIENLKAVVNEDKDKEFIKSEKLIKELMIPKLAEEGGKTDWANRAYAMAIGYEMVRRNPYIKPRPKEECRFKGGSNI